MFTFLIALFYAAQPASSAKIKAPKNTCNHAIEYLISSQGMLNLPWLDSEVNVRFRHHFLDNTVPTAVVPLLLWQNRFYLGGPVDPAAPVVGKLLRKCGEYYRIVF